MDPEAIIREVRAAWGRGDLATIMKFVADDCVYCASVGPEPGETFVGREAVVRLAVRSGDHDRFAGSQLGRVAHAPVARPDDPGVEHGRAPPIAVENNAIAVDEYGNAKGGVRNVFVDVPIATNGVLGKGKSQAQDRLCQLGGTKVGLPEGTLKKLYKSGADYQDRVNKRLEALVKEGWFLPEYVEDVRKDAAAARIP